MVSFAGIGSGLDVNSMVSQLMLIEQKNLTNMQKKEATYQSKISAYGEIKNALSNFQTAMKDLSSMDKFSVYKTTISTENDIDVTSDSHASAGSYTMNVSQLATPQKIASNTGFSDSAAATNLSGTMQLTVNQKSFNIDIEEPNNSLIDIRNAINNAPDNVGIKASIMNVDDGSGNTVSKLVLTSTTTGSANTISLNDISGNIAQSLDISKEMQAAKDAVFTLDGFSITRPTNTITDAIDGLTIHLKQASQQNIDVNLDLDADSVVDSVDKFVKTYNDLFKLMDQMSYYDLNSSNKNDKKNGKLWDENNLSQLSMQLRQEVSQSSNNTGPYQSLSQIGIKARTTNAGDALTLDKDALKKAIETDSDSVAKLFSDSNSGYAVRLNKLSTELLGDDGLIEVRKKSLTSGIKQLETQIDHEERRLDDVQQQYTTEFSKLDTIMQKFSSLSNYLVNALDGKGLG